MDIYLDIASSAEFWRQRYPLTRTPKVPEPFVHEECARKKDDIARLLPAWVDEHFLAPTKGVLHVLSFDRAHCVQLDDLSVHVWSSPLPEGSFHKLKSNLCVESPEFMFLHAATVLDFVELVAFGDELCGFYSFNTQYERGFAKRKCPLTTKKRLEQFLQRSTSCRGRKQAEKALRYVVERSASPMETLDEMTMCLPYRYGGYHLPTPLMNHNVPFNSRAARIGKRGECYLDMGYPKGHPKEALDVEHHGKLDHSSHEDRVSDRARVNAIKEMGYEVIELTAEQVGDLFAYEYIIERIANLLGKRLQKERFGATPERLALRRALFNWNSSSGAIR